jgi:hypothetical protein
LSGENIPLVIVFCQNRTFIWWLSFVRTEHTFGDCLLSEQNLSVEYSFGIVFCQNRTFFWYCFLLEQNIPLVLSSVRTEHAFGIVFWQNRTFLWWLSSVRIEWAFGIVFYQNIAVFWWLIHFCQNRTFLLWFSLVRTFLSRWFCFVRTSIL